MIFFYTDSLHLSLLNQSLVCTQKYNKKYFWLFLKSVYERYVSYL